MATGLPSFPLKIMWSFPKSSTHPSVVNMVPFFLYSSTFRSCYATFPSYSRSARSQITKYLPQSRSSDIQLTIFPGNNFAAINCEFFDTSYRDSALIKEHWFEYSLVFRIFLGGQFTVLTQLIKKKWKKGLYAVYRCHKWFTRVLWPLQSNLLEHSCAISLEVGFVLILSDTWMLGFKPVKEYNQTIP